MIFLIFSVIEKWKLTDRQIAAKEFYPASIAGKMVRKRNFREQDFCRTRFLVRSPDFPARNAAGIISGARY